jgi:hypothetical protein
MKNLGLFLVITIVMFFSVACSAQETNDKAYTATTPEECVHEKECVGNIFSLRATNILGTSFRERTTKKLHKWSDSIRVSVKGDPKWTTQYTADIKSKVSQIRNYIHPQIELNERANFVFVFSEDFKKDVEVTYRKEFYNGLVQTLGEDNLNKLLNDVDDCFVFTFTNPATGTYNIRAAISFINPSKHPEQCIKEHFMSGLGLQVTPEKFNGNFAIENTHDFSILDLFMLSVLYHPDMKQGYALLQISDVFDQIYEQQLKDFNLKYMGT